VDEIVAAAHTTSLSRASVRDDKEGGASELEPPFCLFFSRLPSFDESRSQLGAAAADARSPSVNSLWVADQSTDRQSAMNGAELPLDAPPCLAVSIAGER
jgi:hypothetical protein